jgi:hypothetical protein
MNQAVPDATVTGFESLIPSLNLPDPDDRHVLAAAIVAGADVIVTANLKDFPKAILLPYNIEPQHPEEFILHQLDVHPATVCQAVKAQRKSMKNPPIDVDDYLGMLIANQLPLTAQRLQEYAALI